MDKRVLTLTIPFLLISCSEAPSNNTGTGNDLPTVVSNKINESLEQGRNDGTIKEGWYPKVTRVVSGQTEVILVDYTDDPAYMTEPNFCGTAGCVLEVYAGTKGSFKSIWYHNVLAHRVDESGNGSVIFDFNMRSWNCKNGGDGFECTVKFRFDGNRMINTDGNFVES